MNAMLPFELGLVPNIFMDIAHALESCIWQHGITSIDHYLEHSFIVKQSWSGNVNSCASLIRTSTFDPPGFSGH